MKKNKIGIFFFILAMCLIVMNSTYAVQIFDVKSTSEVYKTSEDDSIFDVPFVRLSTSRMEIDKSFDQEGLFYSTSGIEVKEPLKGIQIMYSTDTVRLNADTEYPIIFTTGNAIINGTIEKTTFIYSTNEITLDENANVKGNIVCYAPTVNVKGTIDGNILGFANKLNLDNVVNGKIKMMLFELDCSDKARVEGGIEVNTTNKDLVIPESVGTSKIDFINKENGNGFKAYMEDFLPAVLGNIVIYLILAMFIKKERLAKIAGKLKDGREVLKNGILSYFGLLIIISIGVALLMVLLNLGVSLLIFAAAIAIIVTLLKNVIFVTLVGELVERKYSDKENKPNKIVTVIMTIIVLELLSTIPVLGEAIKFITFIMALGIVVTLVLKSKDREDTEEKIIKAE